MDTVNRPLHMSLDHLGHFVYTTLSIQVKIFIRIIACTA